MIAAGPVGWLFPAPGGVLFAPDLVNGKTTVIDLRAQQIEDVLDGISMPHFGSLRDRYLVLAQQLLVASYPERVILNRYDVPIHRPWQALVAADNTVLLVLERDPEGGEGSSSLVAVDLGQGRLVYRRPLPGDVRHFALSPSLAVIALADVEADRVVLADPATLVPRRVIEVTGKPLDVAFVGDGSFLVIAVAKDGAGELFITRLKRAKDGDVVIKKQWHLGLAGSPVRMAASPDGRRVAVGLAAGTLQVLDAVDRVPEGVFELPAAPRDVVWCDPSIPGPDLPDWSDDDPPTLDLGG
jgi:hypothetical protein